MNKKEYIELIEKNYPELGKEFIDCYTELFTTIISNSKHFDISIDLADIIERKDLKKLPILGELFLGFLADPEKYTKEEKQELCDLIRKVSLDVATQILEIYNDKNLQINGKVIPVIEKIAAAPTDNHAVLASFIARDYYVTILDEELFLLDKFYQLPDENLRSKAEEIIEKERQKAFLVRYIIKIKNVFPDMHIDLVTNLAQECIKILLKSEQIHLNPSYIESLITPDIQELTKIDTLNRLFVAFDSRFCQFTIEEMQEVCNIVINARVPMNAQFIPDICKYSSNQEYIQIGKAIAEAPTYFHALFGYDIVTDFNVSFLHCGLSSLEELYQTEVTDNLSGKKYDILKKAEEEVKRKRHK